MEDRTDCEVQKGWFHVPGIRDGYRTLKEQMRGLKPALDEARGKTVIDLGCAEGLISIEFAKAGASMVTAIERESIHEAIAKQLFAPYSNIKFVQSDMMDFPITETYDIVLALAVVHKMRNVEHSVLRAAKMAEHLIVFRWPNSYGSAGPGLLHSKFDTNAIVNVPKLLASKNFTLERSEDGPRNELVQYWRR